MEGLDDDDESGGEDEVEVEGCLEDNADQVPRESSLLTTYWPEST